MKEGTSYAEQRMPPAAYPAEKARGGEIILKSKWSRVIFFAGLFGGAVLAIVLALYFGVAG